MTEMRRVTVDLPAHLVDAAVGGSGRDLSQILTQALLEHANREAWKALEAFRGKVDLGATWQELAGKYDD